MERIKYVGVFVDLSNDYKKLYGNGFLINKYTVVTALHVVEKMQDKKYALIYNEKEYVVNPNNIEELKDYDLALIYFDQNIVDDFESQYAFNTKERFGKEEVDWDIIGYYPIGNNRELRNISGERCNPEDSITLSFNKIEGLHPDLSGMSGSPVYVNDLIVGVLTDQKTENDVVREVIVTPIHLIQQRIMRALIGKYIYNHKSIPKNKYEDVFRESFQKEDYFERRCKEFYSDGYESIFTRSLYEHANEKGFKRDVVIVGEGGIGKTFELKNLAVRLYDYNNEVHPVYYELKDFHSGITSLDELSGEIKEYKDSGTPFCLLLDGYDEIQSTDDRDRLTSIINHAAQVGNRNYSIIISSRKNYFRHEMFRSFFELELCPLYQYDVRRIAEEKGIDIDRFLTEVEAKHLERIVEFPFYLDKLLEIFQERDTLPDKAHLMEDIIDYALEKCYKKYGDLGEGLAQTDNFSTKNYLAKIAMAMHYMGSNSISDGRYKILIDKVDDAPQKKILEKCGLIGLSASGNRYFVHRNFFEYFAAKYLNEQFIDYLDGLVSVIQINDGEEKIIVPEYKNIISYIVDIREKRDSMDWLLDNHPTVVECFESDKFDRTKLFASFESEFKDYTEKGLYTEFDGGFSIEKWAKVSDCEEFLLSRIDSSEQENELINALHLLSVAELKPELQEKLMESLFGLLDKKPEDAVVIRLIRLVIIKQIDDGICERLMTDYLETHNDNIIKLLCEYLTVIRRADEYASFAIKAINKCSDYRFISYDIVDCIGSFEKTDSLRAFLSFASESVRGSRSLSCLDRLFSKRLYKNLSHQFKIGSLVKEDRKDLEEVLVHECMRWDSKTIHLWCRFFIEINCETEVLDEFYELCSRRAWEFVLLTLDYSSFSSFIIQKLQSGEFDDKQEYLLMCIQKIPKDNPKRDELMDYLRRDGGETAKAVLRFFSDTEQGQNEDSRLIELEMIFDNSRLTEEIQQILVNSRKDDLTCIDLMHEVYEKRASVKARTAFQLIDSYLMKKDSVVNSLKIFENDEKKKEFFIESISNFIKVNADYDKLMLSEQMDQVREFCNDFIINTKLDEVVVYNHNGCFISANNTILTSVIHVAGVLDLEIPSDKRLEMIYLPITWMLTDNSSRIPCILKNHLQPKEIISRIKYYHEKEMIHDLYVGICLEYGADLSYLDDTLVNIAVDTLLDHNYKYCHYEAWNYLKSVNKLDAVVGYISEEKVSPKIIIDNIESITDFSELTGFFTNLFDQLESCREEMKEDAEYKEVIKKEYPFVFEYDLSEDQLHIICAINHCLQRVFVFLLHNHSEPHIKAYLNEMIEKKKKSHLDYDESYTNLSKITEVKYVDLLITIFEIMTKGEFTVKTEYNTFYSDIQSSFDEIADVDRDAVINKMKELTESSDLRVKRAAYNYLKTKEIKKEEPVREYLDVYAAAEKVREETDFHPFK